MKLPPPARSGEPVQAAHFNALRKALVDLEQEMKRLRVRGGPGIMARHSPSGVTLRATRQPKNGKSTPPSFSILTRESSTEGEGEEATTVFRVTLQPGRIFEHITVASGSPSDDGLADHEFLVEVDGDPPELVPMSADPRPVLVVPSGSTVYAQWKTTDNGTIKGDSSGEEGGSDDRPKLVVSSDEKNSTHYQPPREGESSGTEGEYYMRLLKITAEEDGDTLVEYFRLGDIDFFHELWVQKNLGAGVKLVKGHDPEQGVYEVRSVRGNYGLSDRSTDEEGIFDADFANVGDGCPVWVRPEDGAGNPLATDDLPDDPAKFRSIRGESGNLIVVECEAENPGDPLPDEITVKSSGADVAEASVKRFDIFAVKGIIQSFSKTNTELFWGTIQINFTGTQNSGWLTIVVEDGDIVSATAGGSYGSNSGAGTEGSPRVAVLDIEDTDT